MSKKKEKPFKVIRCMLFDREMTYSDLAKILGLSTPAISKKLSGKSQWKLLELQIMSRKFGKTIDELVS